MNNYSHSPFLNKKKSQASACDLRAKGKGPSTNKPIFGATKKG